MCYETMVRWVEQQRQATSTADAAEAEQREAPAAVAPVLPAEPVPAMGCPVEIVLAALAAPRPRRAA